MDDLLKKKMQSYIAIITIVLFIFNIGIAWAANIIMTKSANKVAESNQEKLLEHGLCIAQILTENVERDKKIDKHDLSWQTHHEWMVIDAQWKGEMSTLIKQSMFFGKASQLDRIKEISDDNKELLEKKSIE